MKLREIFLPILKVGSVKICSNFEIVLSNARNAADIFARKIKTNPHETLVFLIPIPKNTTYYNGYFEYYQNHREKNYITLMT